MGNRETTYLAVKPKKDVTHLRIDVYYALGGINYFTYKQEARGYYLSVSPVGRSQQGGVTMESCVAFSGVKKLILPVNRQSAKRLEEAKRLAAEAQPELISHVLAQNGLELAV